MKCRMGIFCTFCLVMPLGVGAVDFPSAPKNNSYLSAQTFPTTFSDLSFTERIQVKREGYAPWTSEYDNQGRCVSNCAYHGITIKTELAELEYNTELARLRAQAYDAEHGIQHYTQPVTAPVQQFQQPQSVQPTTQAFPDPDKPFVSSVTIVSSSGSSPSISSSRSCASYNSAVRPDQVIPYGMPLAGKAHITSKFGERVHPVTKKPDLHKGVDLAAANGTSIYSPAGGVVENVWTDQYCGKGLRIQHNEGYATQYCHLSEHKVVKGQTIDAGCLVAHSGNTGRSTGPNLHYSVYYNNNLINPEKFF